jgi:hypothetical protein
MPVFDVDLREVVAVRDADLDLGPPADRGWIARLLGDTNTTRNLTAIADAVVYDMTRDASRADVAEQLGTTVWAVQRAVSTHIVRTGVEG